MKTTICPSDMETITIINELPVDYVGIGNLVYEAKKMILSGDHNPLDIEIRLKAMEELVKQLRGDTETKAAVIAEAEKYGKSFEYGGCKISIREGGVKYDYAATGDSEWAILEAQAKEIGEKKKMREKFLQSIPPAGTVSPETGEHIYPPAKTSQTTVAVTLK